MNFAEPDTKIETSLTHYAPFVKKEKLSNAISSPNENLSCQQISHVKSANPSTMSGVIENPEPPQAVRDSRESSTSQPTERESTSALLWLCSISSW